MKILTMDTSAKVAAVSLQDENGMRAEFAINHSTHTHSETMLPLIDSALSFVGWKISDLDAVGVVTGPGSFTGVRIGVAMAKGFAQAADLPVIPICTLDAFARSVGVCSHTVAALMDARRGQVYAAAYTWQNGVCTKTVPDCATDITLFLDLLGEEAVFVGDGVLPNLPAIQGKIKHAHILPRNQLPNCIAGAAAIAAEQYISGNTISAMEIMPYYLRLSQAEQAMLAKEA